MQRCSMERSMKYSRCIDSPLVKPRASSKLSCSPEVYRGHRHSRAPGQVHSAARRCNLSIVFQRVMWIVRRCGHILIARGFYHSHRTRHATRGSSTWPSRITPALHDALTANDHEHEIRCRSPTMPAVCTNRGGQSDNRPMARSCRCATIFAPCVTLSTVDNL